LNRTKNLNTKNYTMLYFRSFAKNSMTLLPFLIVFLNTHGQAKKFDGYAVNGKGDTIHGIFPDFKDRVINPDKIKFIPADSNQYLVLTPAEWQLFHINNYDTYLAYTGTRMTTAGSKTDATNLGAHIYSDNDYISGFIRLIDVADSCGIYIYIPVIRGLIFSTN
jgi:hypothetical protein